VLDDRVFHHSGRRVDFRHSSPLHRLGPAKLATGILLFLGVLLLAIVLSGVMLNTLFLVREIRRNEQHDAFINAVTHELKTPVPSIRLYLETLQTRRWTFVETRRTYILRGSNRWDRVTLKEMVSHP